MEHNLDLIPAEKRKLRQNKIRINEIHHHSVDQLQSILDVSKIRAMELFALSEFQCLPSIGIRFAQDLISMGYFGLRDLKGKNPAKLLDKFERMMGVWIDPCLEDQFRLVVHYAHHPGIHKNWWDFTNERKAFRSKNGYPASRPKKSWYELEQYKKSNRINAASEVTKKDLYKRLKLSIQFMNKNLEEDITVAQLANASHLSPFHFLRVFKSVYELTPHQYLTRLRLKKASRLLRKTKQMVSLIGSQCGFENESAFIRLFKKQYKLTPLSFRKAA